VGVRSHELVVVYRGVRVKVGVVVVGRVRGRKRRRTTYLTLMRKTLEIFTSWRLRRPSWQLGPPFLENVKGCHQK